MNLKTPFIGLLVSLLLANLADAQEPKLQIVIVEGDGAINNIKQRTGIPPVVEVDDENHKPIAGAAVTFFLPSQGPTGTFANGTRTLTALTDANGRATASGIQFSQTGKLDIRVSASFHGQTANTVITQTNIAGSSSSGGHAGGVSTRAYVILGICAGAIAGAVIAATHGGGSSSSSGPAPIVITAGTPTVGGPH